MQRLTHEARLRLNKMAFDLHGTYQANVLHEGGTPLLTRADFVRFLRPRGKKELIKRIIEARALRRKEQGNDLAWALVTIERGLGSVA